MDTRELKEAKINLDNDINNSISKLISEFKAKSGLDVDNISITFQRMTKVSGAVNYVITDCNTNVLI